MSLHTAYIPCIPPPTFLQIAVSLTSSSAAFCCWYALPRSGLSFQSFCSGHAMGIRQWILKDHFWLNTICKLRFILKSNIYLLSIVSLRSDLDNRKCNQTDGLVGLPYFKHQRYQILVKLFHNPWIVCTVQSRNTCVQTNCIDCQRHTGHKALSV